MLLMLAGIVVLILTVIVFIAMLPRGGKTHRFVGTAWEQYVGVAFCAAVALSLTMILSGVISMAGTQ